MQSRAHPSLWLKWIHLALALFLVTGSLGSISSPAPALASPLIQETEDLPYAPGVLLTALKAGAEPSLLLGKAGMAPSFGEITAFESLGMEGALSISKNETLALQGDASPVQWYRLSISPEADVLEAASILQANPAVEFAEPDYLAHALAAPNDPLYPQQWGLAKIGIEAAWDQTKGSAETVIAVLDSGIDLSHEDLSGQLWVNSAEIPGNGLDDDGNGYKDDVHGWNVLSGSGDISDENGHGTQVAGVLAARSDNGKGIAGVCPGCKLMIIKVMQSSGVVNYSDIAAGIAYAQKMGADVINLSLGGYADSAILKSAIEAAAPGAVIVAGAGNDNKSTLFYPAAYADVLAVAGTDASDLKAGFSNYGSWVDVAAPAVDIHTTFSGNNAYGAERGTSLSTPLAAGVAALVRSQHADWSAALVRQQIVNTALNLDAGNPAFAGQLGGGRLAAGAALGPAQPRLMLENWLLDGQINARLDKGQTYDLALNLYNAWLPARGLTGTLTSADPYVTIADNSGTFGEVNTQQSSVNSGDPFRISIKAEAPFNHPIDFRINLRGADGYSFWLDFTLPVRSSTETVTTNITTSRTWTSDRTYVVKANIAISSGATLTIQPGTQILVEADKWIRVDGQLIAAGTPEQPIVMTSAEAGTYWAGLNFTASSVPAVFDGEGNYLSGSLLRSVNLSYARTGVKMVGSAPYIRDCVFENNQPSVIPSYDDGYGVKSIGGSPRIEGSLFRNNHYPIDIDSGTSLIQNNRFLENTGVVIEVNGSATISENVFEGNRGDDVARLLSFDSNFVFRRNRVLNNGGGLSIASYLESVIEQNLIANNGHQGMLGDAVLHINGAYIDLDRATVRIANNTIFGNNGGIKLFMGGGAVSISGNNWFKNGQSDILFQPTTASPTLNVAGNYWGGISQDAIPGRISDCDDLPDGCPVSQSGKVLWQDPLPSPNPDAPAFVQRAGTNPATVGFERATFEIQFSRPMDTSTPPEVVFHDIRKGNLETIGEPFNTGIARAFEDSLGRIWFTQWDASATGLIRFDGKDWEKLDQNNFGLPDKSISVVYEAHNGDLWFGHSQGVSRLRGAKWSHFLDNSVPGLWMSGVIDIDQDQRGTLWFLGGGGVWSYDGTTWKQWSQENGLKSGMVREIEITPDGRLWFATEAGLEVYNGTTWQVHDRTNGLPGTPTGRLFVDTQGRLWTGIESWAEIPPDPSQAVYLAMYDGTWHGFSSLNTGGVVSTYAQSFAENPDGSVWFFMSETYNPQKAMVYQEGTWKSVSLSVYNPYPGSAKGYFDSRGNLWLWGGGISKDLRVLWSGEDYPVVDNGAWVNERTYRATYDFSSLIPQGKYAITVGGAAGTDGMAIAGGQAGEFELAVAGYVSDNTPPSRPFVELISTGSLNKLSLRWNSADPQGIHQYRYALGITPGGREVFDWRYTTSTSVELTGLLLTPGQVYYATVAAQNKSGLWSQPGVSYRIIGGKVNDRLLFLPAVQR